MPTVMVVVASTKEEFAKWLDEKLYLRFGRRTPMGWLAGELRISATTLRKILNAKTLPALDVVPRLARVINVTTVEVERMAGISPLLELDPDHPHAVQLNPEEQAIVKSALESTLRLLG